METDKDGKGGKEGRERYAGREGTDDDDLERFESVRGVIGPEVPRVTFWCTRYSPMVAVRRQHVTFGVGLYFCRRSTR